MSVGVGLSEENESESRDN